MGWDGTPSSHLFVFHLFVCSAFSWSNSASPERRRRQSQHGQSVASEDEGMKEGMKERTNEPIHHHRHRRPRSIFSLRTFSPRVFIYSPRTFPLTSSLLLPYFFLTSFLLLPYFFLTSS
jgi:hypothetical protein